MIKLSRKKLLIFTSLIFALANTGIFLIPSKWASAHQAITYCHRDTNVNQPYGPSSITSDGSSIMQQGHDDHKGPIASSLAIAQALKDDHEKWGDIIPPFFYYNHWGQLRYFEGMNYTSTGQAMIANNCQYVSTVSPTAITWVDQICEASTYTIPTTAGVIYKVNDVEKAAGTYEVSADVTLNFTAVAASNGYTLSGTTSWSHTFTAPNPSAPECVQGAEEVTPDEVDFDDATCDISGSYTVPSKTGVIYYIGDEVIAAGTYNVTTNKTIIITAVADEGYIFPETAKTEWSHTFDIPTAEECVQGAQSVTPLAVTFTAPTCDALGYYTIPSMAGVKYMVNGQVVTAGNHTAQNGTTITVTAVAVDEFYSIKEGATNQWSYTFTAPTNCVLGTTTTTPSTLPLTSGNSNIIATIILSTITTAVIVAGAILRKLLVKQF